MKHWFLVFLTSILFFESGAQQLDDTKNTIADLCSAAFKGRGYVDDGVNKAAGYLESRFKQLNLKKINNSYSQTYSFPVNSFPYEIRCKVDGINKIAGTDFLVDAGCLTMQGEVKLLHFNMKDTLDQLRFYAKIRSGFEGYEGVVLHFLSAKNNSALDSFKLYNHMPALLIRTEEKKLTWTVSTVVNEIPSLTFIDSSLRDADHIQLNIRNQFIDSFACKNLCAYVKGKKSDSMIVFSAHYDHLGMMGPDAMFPGASDNASGVSMILYLASYYAQHKPEYNTVFLLFSGEEAGLKGSYYFTQHPMFDLKQIKLLINIDIMGNAEKGIVVVNGEQYHAQFDLLKSLNDLHAYVPEVRIRGKAKNSDHYYFSEMGIPSVFIYSDGGRGFYHDVFDTATSIDLTNYENVAKLLIEFAGKL